jgi:magnesium transporter
MTNTPTQLQNDVRALLAGGDPVVIAERVRALPPDEIAALLVALHPADSADVLEELQPAQQQAVFAELEHEDAADVLAYLDEDEQADVVANLPTAQLADILDEMEPDDAADVLAELPRAQASAALADMEGAVPVRQLLGYEEESAGGLMTPHAVTLRANATVEQTLALLRALQPVEDLSYYLYVTDDESRLVGVLSLRQLVTADPLTSLEQIMHRDVISIPVDADQEEAARVFARYGLLALPTLDRDGRLVGVITADDVIDVIQEEATEDIYRLANLDTSEDVSDSVWVSSRRRLLWLFINLPTAILAGFVVSRFTDVIQLVPILAAFVPIVAGQGGNAGIQTLTLIVRSLALGEISLRDSWRTLVREATIGVLNGVIFGLCIGLIGFVWQQNGMIGAVVGVAMLLNLVGAAISGTVVPLALRLFKIDPALASGVIVTTVTDVTGNLCLLGLATLLLRYLVA